MKRMRSRLLTVCLGASFGLALAAARAEPPADAKADGGFRTIFDGKTLTGWDGDLRFCAAGRGRLHRRPDHEGEARAAQHVPHLAGRPRGNCQPADFEIKIEFRMPDEAFANSGVQIRSWEEKEKWGVSGYQPDMDWKNEYTGICYGENYRGILANRGQKE